jgi:uncharacterized protein YeaO (DUF488 family)
LREFAGGRVTLVYSAQDTEPNNAVALKEFLDRKIREMAHREAE